ncbi:MAG: hypothetical protein DMF82_20730 [Acidobacteria bacterium]|nr:MAG: hypothetical protein DMF82_20730 [Acidobacteriota bacterium]
MDERPRVLITGASSGIGLACAQLLSSQGWRVFAAARTLPEAPSDATIEHLTVDVRSSSSVQGVADTIVRPRGRTRCGGLQRRCRPLRLHRARHGGAGRRRVGHERGGFGAGR